MTPPLLEIKNLTVLYRHGKTFLPAIRNLDLTLQKGEILAVVGESGCGKSTLALSMIGLLPKEESRVPSGRILFEGIDLLAQPESNWLHVRGSAVSMIFQDPFSSLNPVLSIKTQLQETLELDGPRPDWKKDALALLKKVQLQEGERILESYPHQISGGQRQRVMIALALARRPRLLIADEPTTALDVTVQAEILSLLKVLQKEFQMSMVFITHNLALANGFADRLAVMYAGQVAEIGKTTEVLKRPKHPYTQALLKCLPTVDKAKGDLTVLDGQPPEPAELPAGCAFHPRCQEKFEPCPLEDPGERTAGKQIVRCHLYGTPRAKPGVPINDPASPSATPWSFASERGDITPKPSLGLPPRVYPRVSGGGE